MLIVAVLFVGMLRVYGADAVPAVPDQTVSLESMSAAELESRGDILRSQRDFTEAIRYYQAALKKTPSNSVLVNKIGMTEMKRGNNLAAESAFQKAVKLDSRNADALNNIGAVAFMDKNYGRATKYYKKALAINETNATYHSNLGNAWFAQKKTDRAMAEYTRALELDPEVFLKTNPAGSIARVLTTEDRAEYEFMIAKLYAQRGDAEGCLHWLAKAKEDGSDKLKSVYKDADFAKVRQDPRIADIVPPPTAAGY
jgi:tetratricopeptide (TPR) repeat protein